MGILGNKEEIAGDSPYKDYQLGNQANGFVATLFYTGDSEELESEHGKFICMQGLGFDANAADEKSLLDSCFLASIIPNTMLQGKKKNGAFAEGQAYSFTKMWSKGDKYQGRSSKGHGYQVEKYSLPQNILDSLYKKYNELLPEGMSTSIEDTPKVEI